MVFNPQLTGLRGFAACCVLLWHVHWSGVGGPTLGWYLSRINGQFPVMLFFMLSGYLMGSLYMPLPFTRENVCKYFAARCARVVPLYVASIAIAFLWTKDDKFFYGLLLTHHSGFEPFVHLWTVPVEMQFYAFFPMLWWLSSQAAVLRFAIYLLLLTFWASALAVLVGSLPSNVAPYLPSAFLDERFICTGRWFCLPSYLHVFTLGTLLGSVPHVRVYSINIMSIVIMVLTLWITFCEKSIRMERDTFIVDWHGQHDVHLFFEYRYLDPVKWIVVLLLLFLTAQSPSSTGFLASPLFRFVGNISYGLYLSHYFLYIGTRTVFGGGFLAATIAVVCTFVVSVVSYYYFERPVGKYMLKLLLKSRGSMLV